MPNISRTARLFIAFVTLCGISALGYGLQRVHTLHYQEFLTFLGITIVASRLKLRLPGVNGTMSVNLPFILIATAQLSLFEAMIVAMASTAAQCLPTGGAKVKMAPMLFNISTMAVAVALGSSILQRGFAGKGTSTATSLLLALSAATFFLAHTTPVAAIISLTEGGSLLKIWSSLFHLSFPYYVLSAGMTSLVTAAGHRMGWQIPVLVLPVMYGIYRSYELYFGRSASEAQCMPLVKAAAASN